MADWTFETYNLVLACEFCNGRKKRTFNPLVLRAATYRRSRFSLVHPYIDRVADHIEGGYRGGCDEPTVPRGKTPAGTSTVELFGLQSKSLRQLWLQQQQIALDARRKRDWDADAVLRYERARAELDQSWPRAAHG